MYSKFRKLSVPAAALAVSLISPSVGSADIVHLDDVIIEFSLCVGNDCVNGESFGFDTMRLKENNLRIHFDDTSTSASFPRNDWRIIVNDSSNGGDSYFAIEDSTAGRQVFRVDAGAPANSLRVDSGGDVGIGTSNPVVELQVVDGDSPTLRLEQNGSSGFTPQTFDLVSNEANFFIRDVTNGSQLPFRIKPGADSNALFIAANNDIGFSTDSPTDNLHIRDGSDTFFGLTLEDTTATGGTGTWRVVHGGHDATFRISRGGSGLSELILYEGGNMTIGGELTTSGSCSAGCDRVFDEDYELPSIEEHAEYMFDNRHLPNVGPTAEEGPMNISQKVGGMLNELETAHIYIDQLHREQRESREAMAALEARLARLEHTAD
ncbi:hypothetical protein [Maricaulis sp.]|uniref:hypothetical protein n=1 Tax=Maricaulis sp. TaxID=1486257 RepID=UPI001B222DAE|nr:hypothetical protein [Maricaulis sp.]MBO6797762.1 hypothetical protein [Maricaulis sp.]